MTISDRGRFFFPLNIHEHVLRSSFIRDQGSYHLLYKKKKYIFNPFTMEGPKPVVPHDFFFCLSKLQREATAAEHSGGKTATTDSE